MKSQPTDFPLVRGEDGEAVTMPVKEHFRMDKDRFVKFSII